MPLPVFLFSICATILVTGLMIFVGIVLPYCFLFVQILSYRQQKSRFVFGIFWLSCVYMLYGMEPKTEL